MFLKGFIFILVLVLAYLFQILFNLWKTENREKAYVTWVNNDYYGVGALVLGHALLRSGTKHKLHLLYSDGVSDNML